MSKTGRFFQITPFRLASNIELQAMKELAMHRSFQKFKCQWEFGELQPAKHSW